MPRFRNAETRNYAIRTADLGLLSGARTAALRGGLVERHHLVGIVRHVGNAALIRRMRRQELRRLAAAGQLAHLLPEVDRFMRVITGSSHQLYANTIRFGFLLS